MTVTQILALVALVLLAAGMLRRFLLRRSVTHYNPAVVRTKLKERANVTMLDVRSAGERSRGHIRGSVHIPLQELSRRAGELDKYRASEIICYCQSGSRSLSAAHLLRRQGYRTANLAGGMSAWRFSE